MDRMFAIKEVAAILDCSEKTIKRKISRKRDPIPVVRDQGLVRIPEPGLRRWIASHTRGSVEASPT